MKLFVCNTGKKVPKASTTSHPIFAEKPVLQDDDVKLFKEICQRVVDGKIDITDPGIPDYPCAPYGLSDVIVRFVRIFAQEKFYRSLRKEIL